MEIVKKPSLLQARRAWARKLNPTWLIGKKPLDGGKFEDGYQGCQVLDPEQHRAGVHQTCERREDDDTVRNRIMIAVKGDPAEG